MNHSTQQYPDTRGGQRMCGVRCLTAQGLLERALASLTPSVVASGLYVGGGCHSRVLCIELSTLSRRWVRVRVDGGKIQGRCGEGCWQGQAPERSQNTLICFCFSKKHMVHYGTFGKPERVQRCKEEPSSYSPEITTVNIWAYSV